MTSSENILDNVQYFVGELMDQAQTARQWTSDDVNKAWQWAKYCNKFMMKMLQLGKMDKCVSALARRMSRTDVERISGTLLDPIQTLNRAVLTNSSLTPTVLTELLDLNLNHCPTTFLEDFTRIVVDQHIVKRMATPTLDTTSKELEQFHLRLRRQLLVDQLTEAFRMDDRAIDDYVTESFKSEQSMKHLMEAVSALATSEEAESKQCFEHIVDSCTTKADFRNFVLRQANLDLSKLVHHSPVFHEFYTDFLRRECELLVRKENGIETVWQNGAEHLPFEALVAHWSSLLDLQPEATRDTIKDLAIGSSKNVWLDIWRALSLS